VCDSIAVVSVRCLFERGFLGACFSVSSASGESITLENGLDSHSSSLTEADILGARWSANCVPGESSTSENDPDSSFPLELVVGVVDFYHRG